MVGAAPHRAPGRAQVPLAQGHVRRSLRQADRQGAAAGGGVSAGRCRTWRRGKYQAQGATARADALFGKASVNQCFESDFSIVR